MRILCVVACYDKGGTPDLVPVMVECSDEAYNNGDHYVVAQHIVANQGWETSNFTWVMDEFDAQSSFLLPILDDLKKAAL